MLKYSIFWIAVISLSSPCWGQLESFQFFRIKIFLWWMSRNISQHSFLYVHRINFWQLKWWVSRVSDGSCAPQMLHQFILLPPVHKKLCFWSLRVTPRTIYLFLVDVDKRVFKLRSGKNFFWVNSLRLRVLVFHSNESFQEYTK